MFTYEGVLNPWKLADSEIEFNYYLSTDRHKNTKQWKTLMIKSVSDSKLIHNEKQ